MPGALGGLSDKLKQGVANMKSAVTGEPVQIVVPEETMTQRMLREMDTATTMSWKQVCTVQVQFHASAQGMLHSHTSLVSRSP